MKRFDFIVDSDEHGQQHQLQRIESDTGEYVLYEAATEAITHVAGMIGESVCTVPDGTVRMTMQIENRIVEFDIEMTLIKRSSANEIGRYVTAMWTRLTEDDIA